MRETHHQLHYRSIQDDDLHSREGSNRYLRVIRSNQRITKRRGSRSQAQRVRRKLKSKDYHEMRGGI